MHPLRDTVDARNVFCRHRSPPLVPSALQLNKPRRYRTGLDSQTSYSNQRKEHGMRRRGEKRAEAFIAGCLCRKRKLGQIMIRCDDPSVSCFVYFTNDRILPSQRVS
jgi:hypothetical protein